MAESSHEKRFTQVRVTTELHDKATEWMDANSIDSYADMIRKAVRQLVGIDPSVSAQPNNDLLKSQLAEKDEQIRQLQDQIKNSTSEREKFLVLMAADKAHINYLSKPFWQRWFYRQPTLNP